MTSYFYNSETMQSVLSLYWEHKIVVCLTTDLTRPSQDYVVRSVSVVETDFEGEGPVVVPKQIQTDLYAILGVELTELAESEIGRQLSVMGMPHWNETFSAKRTEYRSQVLQYSTPLYMELFNIYVEMISETIAALVSLVLHRKMTLEDYWALRGGRPTGRPLESHAYLEEVRDATTK